MESNGICGLCTKLFKRLDPLKIYDFEFWVYVFTGCWECKWGKRWKTNLYKTYQWVLIAIYSVAVAFYVMDAIAVKDDLEKLSFNLSTSFLVFVTIFKVSLLYSQRHTLERVYGKLQNNLDVRTIGASEEDKVILKKKAEVLSTLTFSFYFFLLLGLPLRIIADTSLEPKAYLVPVPDRQKVDPYYIYVYASQTVLIFHFLVVVLSHDLLIFSVLVRIIAHYEILAKNFGKIRMLYPRRNFKKYVRGFVEKHENDDALIRRDDFGNANELTIAYIENKVIREVRAHQLLRDNINHHQMLLRETRSFCQLYSLPLLVQSCGAGILIGIVILQIFFISKRMTTLLVEQIMFTVTLLLNVFHLCSFATEINTKSRTAANALYDTPWYEMDVKNRRIVQFAMKKMMEGPKLKGGNMVVINKVTYLKFLRISYNLIAVLRHIY